MIDGDCKSHTSPLDGDASIGFDLAPPRELDSLYSAMFPKQAGLCSIFKKEVPSHA